MHMTMFSRRTQSGAYPHFKMDRALQATDSYSLNCHLLWAAVALAATLPGRFISQIKTGLAT